MKIAYLFRFPLHMGGHFKSALAMIPTLREAGHTIEVIAPGGASELVDDYLAAGGRIHPVPELERWRYLPRASVVERIATLCEELGIELIHAQSPYSMPAAALTAGRLGLPVVVTIPGGPWDGRPPPRWAPCVSYSDELMVALRQAGRPPESITRLIRARFDTSRYRPAPACPEFLERHDLPTTGIRIAIAIRLDRDKRPRLESLLALAAELRDTDEDIHLILAGGGELQAMVEERAREINADRARGPILHVLGPLLDSDEVCRLYHAADIVLGIARGVMEAMACARPVVVLGREGEGEAVAPDTVELIARYNFSGRHFGREGDDGQALSELLLELARDGERRAALAEFVLDYVRTHLDVRIGAAQLLDFYAESTAPRATPRRAFAWTLADSARHFGRRLARGRA
jgi:glycosyltransferase involved in cell wall biosynthesis